MNHSGFNLAAIIYFILDLLMTYSIAECPYQACTCSGLYINCHNQGFDEVPPLNGGLNTYPVLRFSSNKFTSIPDDSLPSGLTEIDFGNNPISEISLGAFNKSALTLEILSFSSTRLTKIPDAFLSLTKLRSLTIKNSPLQDWNQSVLRHISSTLREIVLNNVGLISWPSWIQLFPSLTTLSLSNSLLTPVPDTAFNLITNSLEVLTFTSTGLVSVPKAVATLTNLRSLDLTNNAITEVENLPQFSKLQSLSLGANNISDVYKLVYELSAYSTTLNYLYLHDNKFTTIPRLGHMVALEIINLGRNQITDSLSGSLPSSVSSLQLEDNQLSLIPKLVVDLVRLTNLIINGNSIQEIQANDFPVSLSHLDLQENGITEIKDNSFHVNISLKFLLLSNNPINNISGSAFINLSELTTLELQNTSLTRVPLTVSDLTHLNRLDLSRNIHMICTCQESSLVNWFKSRPTMVTEGTCGDVTVEEFFTNLASQCPGQ